MGIKSMTLVGLLLSVSAIYTEAQSIWNRDHLDSVKTQLDRPMYGAAYSALIDNADRLLDVKPY